MTKQKPKQKPTFKEVQALFKNWRETRKICGPIPQALWDAAISIATPT
ncbi:MAG TPA: hypothetical protein HPP41_03225 [Deltaproteobacteria bacterium]|nr:hypothetical protein [Deltaproteobacteria bacterium]